MLTSRTAILATDDLHRETVHVAPWKDSVLIRELTVDENEEFQKRIIAQGGEGPSKYDKVQAHLVVLSVIDKKGNRVFADTDIEELGRKSARAVKIIFDAAMKLNRLDEQAIDDAEKNSDATHSASIGSDSQNG